MPSILNHDLPVKNRVPGVVGTELQYSQGDTIEYYKSDIVAGGDTSNPTLISRRKYLEMLKLTVENSLKVMERYFDRDILGQRNIHD